ncbi:MAG: hypothetical protein ACXVK3_07755, partial [Candidatus Angelobacter sp.]
VFFGARFGAAFFAVVFVAELDLTDFAFFMRAMLQQLSISSPCLELRESPALAGRLAVARRFNGGRSGGKKESPRRGRLRLQ